MSYLPNSLNQFDVYTYNIQFTMVNPSIVQSNDQAALKSYADGGVLIADNTQDGRYNISRLETVTASGFFPYRNSITQTAQMNITEGNGVTLLDKIVSSAQQLGIANHIEAFYILKIEFNGRDQNDGRAVKGEEFYYAMYITDFTFNLTDSGTAYDITMTERTNLGLSYITNVVKEQITVNARSVGEFVEEFLRRIELNNSRLIEMDENRIYPDLIDIQFIEGTEEWLRWEFEQLNDPLRINGINIVGDLNTGEEKMQINIHSGTSITDIFNVVFSMTEEWKQIQTDQGNVYRADGAAEAATATLDEFPVFYKVIPEIQFLQYDPVRGAYQRRITYNVRPFITPHLIVDATSYTRSITDTGVQNNRVRRMVDLGLLRKRYDYLNTGANTEVLNLDLKFDQTYYNTTAIARGIVGDANVQAAIAGGDVTTTLGRLRESTIALSQLTQQQSTLQRQIDTGRTQAAAIAPNITGVGGPIFQQFDSLIQGAANAELALGPLELQINATRAQQGDLARQFQEEFSLSSSDIAFPVRFEADRPNDADFAGPENDLEGGAITFGAVRSNLENSGDLVSIEMHVRGDPYWLGTPGGPNQGGADFTIGGNFFYLHVFLPQADENEQGRRIPQQSQQLSALYMVTSVINQFNSGRFEQYLSATLDTATNPPTAANALETGAGGGAGSSSASGPRTGGGFGAFPGGATSPFDPAGVIESGTSLPSGPFAGQPATGPGSSPQPIGSDNPPAIPPTGAGPF